MKYIIILFILLSGCVDRPAPQQDCYLIADDLAEATEALRPISSQYPTETTIKEIEDLAEEYRLCRSGSHLVLNTGVVDSDWNTSAAW